MVRPPRGAMGNALGCWGYGEQAEPGSGEVVLLRVDVLRHSHVRINPWRVFHESTGHAHEGLSVYRLLDELVAANSAALDRDEFDPSAVAARVLGLEEAPLPVTLHDGLWVCGANRRLFVLQAFAGTVGRPVSVPCRFTSFASLARRATAPHGHVDGFGALDVLGENARRQEEWRALSRMGGGVCLQTNASLGTSEEYFAGDFVDGNEYRLFRFRHADWNDRGATGW